MVCYAENCLMLRNTDLIMIEFTLKTISVIVNM